MVATLVSSCGGQDGLVLSGSGESGIGGTGISYVKGNVSAINGGELTASASTRDNDYSKSAITGTTVSGGGRTAIVQQDGSFILNDVTPQAHMILSFKNSSGMVSTLDIGNVGVGEVSLVSDVSIDYITGKASARTIRVIENNPVNTPTPGQGSGTPPATGNPEAGQSGSSDWPPGKDGPCGYDPRHTQGCSQGNRNDGGVNGGNNGNNGNNNNNNGNNS